MKQSEPRQHYIWRSMIARCYNPKSRDWLRYGGRGIKVCKEWHSFENFWNDTKASYRDDLQIERIDNNGDYGPFNCRWATRKEQARNTRKNVLLKTEWGCITLAEAAERAGLPSPTIETRIRNGWPEEKLLVRQRAFKKQARNERVISTPWGKMNIKQAATKSGIGESLIRYRLRTDWPRHRLFEKAFRTSRHG